LVLYDENLLHWKEIPATDIIAFAKKKFNIDWTDAEMNFTLTILQNDGYIVLNKVDPDSMKMPTFSLTTKGVQMKRKGGFTKTKLVEDFKNNIILWGSILAFIVGVMTIFDLTIKFTSSEKICPCCEKTSTPNKTNNNNNCDTTLTKSSPKGEVVKSDTITKSIKK